MLLNSVGLGVSFSLGGQLFFFVQLVRLQVSGLDLVLYMPVVIFLEL